jgi:UDP-2,4-diacetamido-2,4,6-trideoxy-beta-L-altropyranose hydrolase
LLIESKTTCLIFTELLSTTGLGHFNRCLAIYESLIDMNFSPILILNSEAKITQDLNVELIDWTIEVKLNSIFEKFSFDIAIVDSYLASLTTYELIQQNCKKMVCIDDFFRIEYPQNSIILNPSLNGADQYYPENLYKIFSGKEFIILRKEFAQKKNSIKKNRSIENILITSGGTDQKNIIPAIIEIVRKVFKEVKINIIIGKNFKNVNEIQAKSDTLIQFHFDPNVNQIVNLMNEVDLAITSGGQTLYELSKFEVPMIVFKVAENQTANIQGFLISGSVDYVGSVEDQDFLSYLENSILNAKSLINKSNPIKIDGLGANRFVKKIIA